LKTRKGEGKGKGKRKGVEEGLEEGDLLNEAEGYRRTTHRACFLTGRKHSPCGSSHARFLPNFVIYQNL